jgi:hypothetical protein
MFPALALLIGHETAAAAPVADGVPVATEGDRTVTNLKGIAGNAKDQTAWEHKTPRQIPRKIAVNGDLAAVAYWSGTVRVFDGAGIAKLARTFPQNVADIAWLRGDLAVALADGQISLLSY